MTERLTVIRQSYIIINKIKDFGGIKWQTQIRIFPQQLSSAFQDISDILVH